MNGFGQEGTFYLFAGFCFAGGLLFLFVMKETNGLTKEEQQVLYAKDKKGQHGENSIPLVKDEKLNSSSFTP